MQAFPQAIITIPKKRDSVQLFDIFCTLMIVTLDAPPLPSLESVPSSHSWS